MNVNQPNLKFGSLYKTRIIVWKDRRGEKALKQFVVVVLRFFLMLRLKSYSFY